jgi:hypothetical protein
MAFPIGLILFFFLTHAFDDHQQIRKLLSRAPAALVLPALLLAWVLSITISAGNSAKFIYFDF